MLTEFMVLSGLRYGEVCGLDKSDVSQTDQMIHVTKNSSFLLSFDFSVLYTLFQICYN